PGFAGEVMSELGVAVTNLPPGELYTSLERGTIDAVEWVGPALDLQMGFHQIAKFYYSGWQEPNAEVQFLINKKTWDKLPADLQEVLRVSMRTAAYDMYIQSTHESGVAWQKMKQEYPDVTHKVFPPEVVDALRTTTNRLLDEFAAKDELANEIISSQRDYLQQVRPGTNISDKAYLNSVADQEAPADRNIRGRGDFGLPSRPLSVWVRFWKNTPLKLWAGPMKQTLLSLSNLSKQFDGKTVLDSLDHEIFDGEFITLLWPSGCGRSYLLRSLAVL